MKAAVVTSETLSDGQWHWLVNEVTSSHLSLLLDNSLLSQQ